MFIHVGLINRKPAKTVRNTPASASYFIQANIVFLRYCPIVGYSDL